MEEMPFGGRFSKGRIGNAPLSGGVKDGINLGGYHRRKFRTVISQTFAAEWNRAIAT